MMIQKVLTLLFSLGEGSLTHPQVKKMDDEEISTVVILDMSAAFDIVDNWNLISRLMLLSLEVCVLSYHVAPTRISFLLRNPETTSQASSSQRCKRSSMISLVMSLMLSLMMSLMKSLMMSLMMCLMISLMMFMMMYFMMSLRMFLMMFFDVVLVNSCLSRLRTTTI